MGAIFQLLILAHPYFLPYLCDINGRPRPDWYVLMQDLLTKTSYEGAINTCMKDKNVYLGDEMMQNYLERNVDTVFDILFQ